MKEMLKSIFGKKDLKTLSKKSDKILDVFTQTQKKCEVVNGQILDVVSKKEQEMAKIQQEMETLKSVHEKNSTLIKKVQKFVEPENQKAE